MNEHFRRSWNRFLRTALVAWLLAGCILAVALWFVHPTFLPSGDPKQDLQLRPRADFMVFYGAGLLLASQPEKLYRVESQAIAQSSATGLHISKSDLDFNAFGYPPVVAMLFVPFTLLDYRAAYFLMTLLNLFLLGLGIFLLSDRLGLEGEANQVFVLCSVSQFAVYAALLQGHVSFVTFILFIFVISNLRSGHVHRAGLWSGLLAFKPTLLPAILCWFVLRRQWKAFGYALSVALGLAAISIALIGLSGVGDFLNVSRTLFNGATYLSMPRQTFNLRALTDFAGLGDWAWFAGAAAVLAALGFAGQRSESPESGDWEYCGIIFATILAARHVLVHTLTITLIVVALVLRQSSGRVSVKLRWSLFLLMLFPAVHIWATSTPRGSYFPIGPVVILGLFVYFVSTRPPVGPYRRRALLS